MATPTTQSRKLRTVRSQGREEMGATTDAVPPLPSAPQPGCNAAPSGCEMSKTHLEMDAEEWKAWTWSGEQPAAVGWWWLRRKGQDLCGRPVWGPGQIVAVYPDCEGLFYLNGFGAGTAAVIRIKTLCAEWAEWAGPLPEPVDAPDEDPTQNAPSSSLHPIVGPLCDACAKAIRHENADDEYLKLTNPYRPGGGCVTDVAFPPLLERPMNFCDMRCLCAWAAKQISPFTGEAYWPNDGAERENPTNPSI